MFKVLIIDDEPIIRKGIRNIVNWDGFGCEICGEADNGFDGKEIIEKCKPDIIITDIRMPEVDGLTMISEIKETVPDCKIIILTGYRDFEYVREAIKLGAFDYLLKPTKIEELNNVVTRAVKELKNRCDKISEIDKMKKLYEKNLPFIKEKLLYNLIYGTFTEDSATLSQAESLGMKIEKFILGLIEIDENSCNDKKAEDTSEEETNLSEIKESNMYQFGIINTLDEVFSDKFEILSLPVEGKRIAFVLKLGQNKTPVQEEINTKCRYLQQIVQNCFGFTVSVAISTPGEGYKNLSEKLKECKEAIEHKFYLGSNSIIFYSDLGNFFKYSDYSELTDKQQKLIDNVKAGNSEEVNESYKELTDTVNALGDSDKEYIKNFYFNTIILINSIRQSIVGIEKQVTNESALANLYKMVEKCDNLNDLNGVLENAAKQTVSKVHDYNSNNLKLLLRRAVEYIENHYAEEVTLNQVSEKLYVSNYYLSRMFKKELGVNFIDYLNELRMKEAKILLADPKYKTYEVAELVGVPNSHYFSKLFRRYAGMTASEYRESLNKTEKGRKTV